MADNDGAKKYSPPLDTTKSAFCELWNDNFRENKLTSMEREVAGRICGVEAIDGTIRTCGSP